MASFLFTAALLLFASIVQAHTGCSGQHIGQRNLGMTRRKSFFGRGVDSESSAAISTVLAAESNFPTIWEIASIVSEDTTAAALFSTINATVNAQLPNIKVKGLPDGDFSSFDPTYNTSDPDCWWTWSECTVPKEDNLSADVTTVPEPNTWGLTFDDGPNCSHNAFYDYLLEQNQKATMFYIGSNVMDWPYQAQRGRLENHELGVHTWSHHYMTALTNEQVFSELYYTRAAIQLVTGVTPKKWRPPYGDIDNRVRLIAKLLNLTSVLWSDDSEDWSINTIQNGALVTEATVDSNYQSVIDKVSNDTYIHGGNSPIVLTHELSNFTMSEAIKWLPKIKAAFSAVVPICVAYNDTSPYVEANITFPSFATYVSGTTNESTTRPAGSSVPFTSASASNVAVVSSTGVAASASAAKATKASGAVSLKIFSFAGVSLVAIAGAITFVY